MKSLKNTLLATLLLLSITSCADDCLTVKGTITGMPEDAKLVLINADDDQRLDSVPTLCEQKAKDKFTLTATLEGPTMLWLMIMQPDPTRGGEVPVAWINFMAGNDKVEIGPVAFEDLQQYDLEDSAEENVKVSGAKAQEEYLELIKYLGPEKGTLRGIVNEGRDVLTAAFSGLISEDNDTVKMYMQRIDAAQKDILKKQNEFISLHPDYAISALYISRDLSSNPSYSAEQIDSLVALVANNPDKRRLDIINQNAEKARAHAIGSPLGNEEVTMADGTINHLQDLLNKDGYTLIDCWASWCGPCRRAIPKVKEMSKTYAGSLAVVSISCDQSEADWRKAMEEEQMTWPQAFLTPDQARPFMTNYNIDTIPRLMLIKDGKIVLTTADPAEVETYLAANK